MKYNKLPRGNELYSEIGIGLGSLHESSEEEIVKTVNYAIEHGVNYFDMIASYNSALVGVAKALKGKREKVYLQVHFGATYPNGEYNWCRDVDAIKKEYHRLIEDVGFEYIDNGFIQCVDDEDDFNDLIKSNGVLDFMKSLKEEGKIKHLGFSSHNPKIVRKFLKLGIFDLFMFSINPSYDYFDGEYAKGEALDRMNLYKEAEAMRVGITVMKPFGGGQLLDAKKSPFKKALTRIQCLSYVLDKPGVMVALPGIRGLDDLKDILKYEEATPEEKDYTLINSLTPSNMKGVCVYCNHCHPCPVGINIGLINKYYDLSKLGDELAKDHYSKLNVKASACIQCGHCNSRCPFHVNQMDRMQEIKDYFGD